MRKLIIFVLACICAVLLYFTTVSAEKAFRSEWKLPRAPARQQAEYRLVLITQELETPFWDRVGDSAKREAAKAGAGLEVWGSYGNDPEEFLKKLEIAIDAKVDGIIVQGLDSDAFKELTKYKAAFFGIPVITVANDVPMGDSLRKTYVGSNQYLAGRMIAGQLLEDMGPSGTVLLLGDSGNAFYQRQRLSGIRDALGAYPGIRTEYEETRNTREQVIAATQDLMNRFPDAEAFVAVNASLAGAMVQEIGRRARVEPYDIYTFDDSPDALSLFQDGKLDGMIEQSPEAMGRLGVDLLLDWLKGDQIPLDSGGYYTDIRIRKADEAP
ncbi:substrate-binding domain-containing protein [Cohnella caldifontis]|uniref:substrate-binding domain-containing protein n=1 Tax=Cohnella caldifontis TaxID=3027471 RepID=UPI0023EA8273|nr:substrate-binding domain-containing protein [Cohnella sp. YIM B05605]